VKSSHLCFDEKNKTVSKNEKAEYEEIFFWILYYYY